MGRFIAVTEPSATPVELANIATVIQDGAGLIDQTWGGSVFIGEASPAVQQSLASQTPGVAFVSEALAPEGGVDLDETSAALAAAWNVAHVPPFDAAWADFGPADTGTLPEGGCGGGAQPAAGPLLAAELLGGLLGIPANNQVAAPLVHLERRALVNTVGMVIVEIGGPAGSAAEFLPQDRITSIASASRAIQILTTLAPAGAHLVLDVQIRRTQISVDPNTLPFPVNPAKPTASEYETIEKLWRDPALAKLGASAGRAGFRDVVRGSSFLFDIDWGFVLILTKYRAAWPGYAPDYRDVIIAYGMQPDLTALPAVIAHEIGHTVGAFDEYPPGCQVLHKCGFNNGPNLNCAVGNPFSVDCLMKNNAATVCVATTGHFGWGDQNLDGKLDPFDPTFIVL